MKHLILFSLAFLCTFSAQSQIRENTVHCIKGSDAHLVEYCADLTPCKIKTGPNGDHTVCLAGTPNPPAGALISSSSCWSMVTEYTCLEYVSDCSQYLSDSACHEDGTRQCTKGADSQLMLAVSPKLGQCASYTRSFSCIDPSKPSSASTAMTTECDTSSTMDGLDWSTRSPSASEDFVMAATSQEFARQLAVYGSKGANEISGLFPGSSQGCTEGYLGLRSCCKSNGGGSTSNKTVVQKVTGQIAFAAFTKAGGYAVQAGTAYVADTILTNAPEFMMDGIVPIINGGMRAGGAAGFGAMGFGTTAGSAAGMFAAETSSTLIGSIGGNAIYFNPYALAAAVAIQLIMDAISCTQAESDLANAKSQNLCHYIGTFCSQEVKFLGATIACNETTQTYCCFNGLLAKAVEEGAHDQLGISWGSPQDPACGGLSVAQLTSLDFSASAMKDAMKPFQKQIMDNFNSNAAPSLSSGAIQGAAQNTATQSASALCLQRQKLDPKTVCN